MRAKLVESRIEHLPSALRTDLDFVVDIGANVGQWISAFMTFAKVRRLEVFEPNPEAFEILKTHFDKRPDMYLHNLALGEAPATVKLNVLESSALSSLLPPNEVIQREYAPGAKLIRQVPVKVVSLDDVISNEASIDLMKIDVQGFEHSVLRGARKTLRRTRALLIETNFTSHYVGDGSFGTLSKHLNDLDFDFWDMSAPYRGSAGQALWADAVFLNRALTRTG